MLKLRSVVLTLVVLVPLMFSPGRSASAHEAGQDTRSDQSSPRTMHIVAYDQNQAPDKVVKTVEQAGGEVVDMLDALDLALVASKNENFLPDVTATDTITGGARNQVIGTSDPSDPSDPDVPDRRFDVPLSDEERELGRHNDLTLGPASAAARADQQTAAGEPLAPQQWGMTMVGATPEGAQATATGQGVTVGIIDTGIDGTHPDLAGRVDPNLSRDFVQRDSAADIDPAGHGTHVAGITGAGRNGLGMTGVAPDATLVNLRAGQESGHFFAYEVASALVAAGDLGLDVVNMSFYTDPWLYNCASRDDYISGDVTDEQIAEQAMTRQIVLDALRYAHDRGVTLVAAAGNEHTDMSAPQRHDTSSPGFPAGAAQPRTVTNNCLDLPSEGPDVITVSSVGPSGAKADYANYGLGSIDLMAGGGWFGDHAGTPQHQQANNLVLSTFPLEAAHRQGLVDSAGQPRDVFSVRNCNAAGCALYTYQQGTSMAAPFVAGVAALVIQRHGEGSAAGGYSLDPRRVAEILTSTATDKACPPGGVADYTAAGRTADWNAPCAGTPGENSLYGHGVVDAAAAVR